MTAAAREIEDFELVQRAVRNARPVSNQKELRWACVAEVFGCGSTVAQKLCKRFGLDPDTQIKPPARTARNRVERIGNATLYLGDCLEILPALPIVDAVITDPPYGIGADRNLRANQRHGKAVVASKDYGAGEWDGMPPDQAALALIATKAPWQIFWGGNYFRFDPSACWLVWDKDNGDNGYADCELAWTNLPRAVRKFRWRWMGMLQEGAGDRKEERVHPTQKPVALMEWCLNLVPDANTVLDPYMGSGTTGVACQRLGRTFTGIERDERYFDIACERIENAQRQSSLLDAYDTTSRSYEQVGLL